MEGVDAERGRSFLSGVLDVLQADARAHDVFSPLTTTSPGDGGYSGEGAELAGEIWLSGYATLSRNLLEIRRDTRLFRQFSEEPERVVQLEQPLMGLRIGGGRDYGPPSRPVFVAKLPDEIVAQGSAGEMFLDDEILAVNDVRLSGHESHQDVADLLQEAEPSGLVRLTLTREKTVNGDAESSRSARISHNVCVPLVGVSVWQDASVISSRHPCSHVAAEDWRGNRCFFLFHPAGPGCLFRARSEADAEKWVKAIQDNVFNLLQEAMFTANTALEGHVGFNSIQHLAWMRTWRLQDDEQRLSSPPRRQGEEIQLVAITDTVVSLYDSHPPVTEAWTHTSAAPSRKEVERRLREQVAFWCSPAVGPLPIVQSRITETDSRTAPGSLPRGRSVILRTGLEDGLERRVLLTESRPVMTLWKTAFRKVWQVIPSTLLNMSFTALWHGQMCSIVLDQQDAISVFVEGSRQKLMCVPFNSIKVTNNTDRHRFNIWLDQQSCVTFKFDESFKPFQCAFITYLAYHKSGMARRNLSEDEQHEQTHSDSHV